MSDSEEETPISARNLIQGFEKGDVYQAGDVKSSEKPEIIEPHAKNVISDFEAGKMFNKGEISTEKPDILEPVARSLISSFEKGGMYKAGDVKSEKPVSRPGATRKLQKVYESFDQSAKDERPSQSPTSPSPKPTTSPPNEEYHSTKHATTKEEKQTAHGKDTLNKTVLLVYAHWNTKGSFNAALHDVAKETLTKQGYEVIESDLYTMKWNPVLSFEDVGENLESLPSEPLNYLAEVKDAVENGNVAADISLEHEKVKRADLIIFQFPISWLSFPAIMKGWLDRVLCNGFAFVAEQGKLYDEGLLKGKKAMLSITTGGTESVYGDSGINGDIEIALWPMQYGALRFCGFDILPPQICFGVTLADDKTRSTLLVSWEERLKTIFDEEPLNFVPISQFDLKKGLVLRDDAPVLKTCAPDVGLTIGHHLGRAIPRGSMTGELDKMSNGK